MLDTSRGNAPREKEVMKKETIKLVGAWIAILGLIAIMVTGLVINIVEGKFLLWLAVIASAVLFTKGLIFVVEKFKKA